MGYSSDASGAARPSHPITENFHISKTKGKQNEPLPTPVELSKEVLSKLDTVPPGSNSTELRENHQIVSKDSDSTTDSEDQINELGTNTLIRDKQNGDYQEQPNTTSFNEVDSQPLLDQDLDAISEEELAILAEMEAFKMQMAEENKLLDNEEAKGRSEVEEGRSEVSEGKQDAASQAKIAQQERVSRENVIASLNFKDPDHFSKCYELSLDDHTADRAIKFDRKDLDAAKRLEEKPDNFCFVVNGKLHISPAAQAKVLERGINLKEWIDEPFDEIVTMSKEQIADLKEGIKHHINQLTAPPPSSEPEVEEHKETHEPVKHRGDARTELEARERAEKKEREHVDKRGHRPIHFTEHAISETLSPGEFLQKLLEQSEKHHEQNYEKLMKFLEHEYILSEANKYSDNLKHVQENDTELSKATFERLKDEAIHKLDGSKKNFDKIVNGILEFEKQRQLNLLNADPSVKIKVRYEFLHKMLSSIQAKYDRITNENLSIQERETYLKGYFDKVCILLIEAFKSTSTSTNTPQSGML